MSIAITEDHRLLAATVDELLRARGSRAAARALLEAPEEHRPAFWDEVAGLGWLGLHVPEAHGGSGYGLEELVVVAEELGRGLAPGPFVPTMIAAAVLADAGPTSATAELLARLATGGASAAVALAATAELRDGLLHGSAPVALGGAIADVALVPVGDDVAVIELRGPGVAVTTPRNIDPTRRSAQLALDGAPATIVPGAAGALRDLGRLLLAAEATGVARECTHLAAEYAKVRVQFGRPIATFQAVKHHCANMLVATELATAAVWDAARAAAGGGAERGLTTSIAATLAAEAADLCANLDIQVHGGIGFTYEHDAHLYLRRAVALGALLDPTGSAVEATAHVRASVRRRRSIDLPPEAEAVRETVRAFFATLQGLSPEAQRDALVDAGYATPHWPKPWGRAAGAVEQLVIEQEYAHAGMKKPSYSITGWVILTLVQHATEDQIARWVMPALRQQVIWCQLFSEPDAGSDAAGIKTRATRVDGGWIVNGQKVWTSGAHLAGFGLATVRTDPDKPKHAGITTMVIDMHAPGVEVRPIRMPSGQSEFNEVFFSDVFVPDDDVVGPVDGGWTVARATLGNESVSLGGGDGAMLLPGEMLLPALDAHPDRMIGGAARVGRYIATSQTVGVLNLRAAHRAVAGGAPGPEGAVTKLLLSECAHEAAAISAALAGPEAAYAEGAGSMSGALVLVHRALSIAGGTSEIKRNQIAERMLGLPRDPLINN